MGDERASQKRMGFKELRDYYEHMVYSGKLKPGQMLPTEPELARKHNVTRTTIRRAFSPLVRRGLFVKRPGQGTFVGSKGDLQRRSQASVAVLAPSQLVHIPGDSDYAIESMSSTRNYHFMEAVTGALGACGRSSRVYYFEQMASQESWKALTRRIDENGDVAVIAISMEPLELVDRVRAMKMPTVFIDSFINERSVHAVKSMNRQGVMQATSYLLENTPGPLAFVGSATRKPSNPHTERFEGFVEAHRRLRRPLREDYVFYEQVLVSGGREAAKKILDLSPLPTGVVCSDDLPAMGVLEVLQDAEVSVPDQVSIIGFGGSITDFMVIPTLSTVDPDRMAMGERAVDLLEKQLSGASHRQHVIEVPARLCLRQSTIPPLREARPGAS